MMSTCTRDLQILKQERNLFRNVLEGVTKIAEVK